MLCRLILVIGSLVCVSILTFEDYNQWQDNLVTSSLKVNTSKRELERVLIFSKFKIFIIYFQSTSKEVKDTLFPSVTICTEGINMDAVTDAVAKDYYHWLKEEKNTNTEREHAPNVKEFLNDLYGVRLSYNISVEDIALAYSSPDPDKYVDNKHCHCQCLC